MSLTLRTEIIIERINYLKPAGHNGTTQTMKAQIDIDERSLEHLIHDAAEYYGDDWVKTRLDLNWKPTSKD